MSDDTNFRGIHADHSVHESKLRRDTRPQVVQMLLAARRPEGMLVAAIIAGTTSILYPLSIYFTVWMLPLYAWYIARGRPGQLPMRLPESADRTDPGDPIPGRSKFRKARGTYFLGNERGSMRELWVGQGDLLTHMLVFGTTGSGKTQTLLSMSLSSITAGGGVIYTDPKGGIDLFLSTFAIARFLGRDDDVLLTSYSTQTKTRESSPRRLTSTLNPLSFGTPEQLTQLMVALLPSSEGGNAVFQQNAQSLIAGVMRPMCWLRDNQAQPFSIDSLRDALNLEKCIEIAEREDIAQDARLPLLSVLKSFGFREGVAFKDQPRNVGEQFGYARMYFNKTLQSMSDTYDHMFNCVFGEVDLLDVIKQRRILVNILPSMEKSSEESSNIGRITLMMIRNAVASGLGSDVEGNAQDLLSSRPTAGRSPTLNIVDEYAAIHLDGFAELLTQGRSLGVATCVANQDFAGLKKASESEANQIVSNTRIKAWGTMEESSETWKLLQEQAGKEFVPIGKSKKVPGANDKPSMLGDYQDSGDVQYEERERVNLLDVQEQIEGEFHILFRGRLVRSRMFYAGQVLEAAENIQGRINRKIEIIPPSRQVLEHRYGNLARDRERLEDVLREGVNTTELEPTHEVEVMRDVFARPTYKQDVKVITIAAFVSVRHVIEGHLERMRDGKKRRGDKGKGGGRAKASALPDHKGAAAGGDYAPGKGHATAEAASAAATEGEASTQTSEADEVMQTTDPADLAPPGRATESADSAADGAGEHQALTEGNADRLSSADAIIGDEATFDEDVASIEESQGASPEQAQETAERYRQDIHEAVTYPEQPKPEQPDQAAGDQLSTHVNGIVSKLRQTRGANKPSDQESPDS